MPDTKAPTVLASSLFIRGGMKAVAGNRIGKVAIDISVDRGLQAGRALGAKGDVKTNWAPRCTPTSSDRKRPFVSLQAPITTLVAGAAFRFDPGFAAAGPVRGIELLGNAGIGAAAGVFARYLLANSHAGGVMLEQLSGLRVGDQWLELAGDLHPGAGAREMTMRDDALDRRHRERPDG